MKPPRPGWQKNRYQEDKVAKKVHIIINPAPGQPMC